MADMQSFPGPCDGNTLSITEDMQHCFDENGYVLVRSLLSTGELGHLKNTLESNSEILEHSYVLNDGHGSHSRLALWNQPGNDVTGMVARCEKVAGTVEKLLGGEVYHYHSKLMMKEAHTGGCFVWHQDYGYWYNNGCLFPDMMTVFIAIDDCDLENGCLKILSGSHRAGRVEHIRVGGQTGADVDRVNQLEKVLPLLNVVMKAGDALFFHCNLLHRSEQNHSHRRRWALAISYNKASNNPVIPHHHPQYTPLSMVSNGDILACRTTELSGKEFMDPDKDQTAEGKRTV